MLHTHLSALKYCHNHPDTLFNNHRISASLLTKHIRWHKCVNAMRKCKHASDTAKKTHKIDSKNRRWRPVHKQPSCSKNTHLHLSKRLVQPDMIYWQASVNGPSDATNQLPTDARMHSVVCAYHNIIKRCMPPFNDGCSGATAASAAQWRSSVHLTKQHRFPSLTLHNAHAKMMHHCIRIPP